MDNEALVEDIVVDVRGQVKNTHLAASNPLLPLFEAIVNSFHAIEDLDNPHEGKIIIKILRDAVISEGIIPVPNGFKIIDNGIGFNKDNYNSFRHSNSLHKEKKGGKGLGRFLWLKAFKKADISSRYNLISSNGNWFSRNFSFTINGIENHVEEETDVHGHFTSVQLNHLRDKFRKYCPKESDTIAKRIIEHCLPFFRNYNSPQVLIEDSNDTLDVSALFRKTFGEEATTHELSVEDQTFKLHGFKIFGDKHAVHKLVYLAHNREVMAEDLRKYVANLQKRIPYPPKGNFVYVGFIEGDYLDNNVSNDRSEFFFPKTKNEDDFELVEEICLSDIRDKAIEGVKNDLTDYLGEIDQEKERIVRDFINQEAPQYKVLLPNLSEFLDLIRPDASMREIEMALHEQLMSRKRQLKQDSDDFLEGPLSEEDKQSYDRRRTDLIERLNKYGKADLINYIIHRKAVLEIFEKALSYKDDEGHYNLEETVHQIVYPMKMTSEEVPYEEQNLWIIDERLNYHTLLASDKSLKSVPILDSESLNRPDLIIFDRALAFSTDATPITSIVIVEFKKPGRTDYHSEDPISQIYRLVRDIRSGTFKSRDGRFVQINSNELPVFAHIICDITESVKLVAQEKALSPTPDRTGFFGYNPSYNAYVEIISYDKLLKDAKMRNAILFDKLGIAH